MKGSDFRVASVMSIDQEPGETTVYAHMVDHSTANSFQVPLSAPGGVVPVPGDQWMLTGTHGFWNFERCLVMADRTSHPQTSFAHVMDTLRSRGLVADSFMDSSRPEAPHLAYIGEVRMFLTTITPDPHYWVLADGGTVPRLKYRELSGVIDPAGTSINLTVPLVSGLPATVQPYVCAR